MFAVVNQRRYRSAFWMSFATLFLSILLCIQTFKVVRITLDNDQRETWKQAHYLIVLPICALL